MAAICDSFLLRRGGVLDRLLIDYAGFARGEVPLPPLYNLGGAILIIGLVTYPYIYLPTAAALRSVDRSLEEAARMSGRSGWQTFRQIALPLVLPAVAGGALLVGLYLRSAGARSALWPTIAQPFSRTTFWNRPMSGACLLYTSRCV